MLLTLIGEAGSSTLVAACHRGVCSPRLLCVVELDLDGVGQHPFAVLLDPAAGALGYVLAKDAVAALGGGDDLVAWVPTAAERVRVCVVGQTGRVCLSGLVSPPLSPC